MGTKLSRTSILSVLVATAAVITIAIMAVASLQLPEQQQVANGSIGPINSPGNRPQQLPSPGPSSPSDNDGQEGPSEDNGKDSTIQRDEEGPTTKVPIAISEDNIYFAWWTNRTGNDEVQFRASTDGGVTFADKVNLSNTTDAESQDVDIAAEGSNVLVTWWKEMQLVIHLF